MSYTLPRDASTAKIPYLANLDNNSNPAIPTEQYILVNGVYQPVSESNPLPTQLTGSNTTNLILASHVTTTGEQVGQKVNGYSGMRLNIWGDSGVSFSVNLQGQMNDGTWYTLPSTVATVPSATATTSAIVQSGIYDFDVANFTQVALLVNSISGQSVGIGINAEGGFQP